MPLACSQPFNNSSYPRCDGVVSHTSGFMNELYYDICPVDFDLAGSWLHCSGSLSHKKGDQVLEGDIYFELDTYENVSGFFKNPVNLTSQTWSIPNAGGMTLSPVEYSQLIGLAIPSLIIAFTFNMIFRQIINRN